MKCSKCQSEISADARFCGECGQPVVNTAPPSQEAEIDFGALRTMDAEETRAPRTPSAKLMQPGDVFADRYKIEALIGEGGMGVVYRAHDNVTEKVVALKLIRAERLAGKDAVKRLIREGVTSRDIRHSNVVAVYDVNEAGGQPYMSMEFLGGQSLRAWNRARMQSNVDCSMKTASNIIGEILAGLEAAHKAGVVHRDLKPENVMLVGDPTDAGVQLKILDFGVARAAGAGDTGATSLGTRGYMAPEQITAPDAAQPSADLYSLSVMFYELLVGVVPQGHWQPPSGGRTDVPPDIDQLVQKGLSNNPRARPQNVAEYAAALDAAMKAGGMFQSDGPSWLERIEKSDFKPLLDSLKTGFNSKLQGGLTGGNGRAPSPTGSKNFWQWFVYAATKRFADGKGRAHRKEFWGFTIFAGIFMMAALMIDISILESSGYSLDYIDPSMLQVSGIAFLALVIPSVAVTSRRLHDQGYSGWIAALTAIPTLGFFVSILVGLQAGTRGDNAYGPDPLAQG